MLETAETAQLRDFPDSVRAVAKVEPCVVDALAHRQALEGSPQCARTTRQVRVSDRQSVAARSAVETARL
jgi:hypothetical protein